MHFTFMHSRAARFASCVSVDGPLMPDCSVPLRVSQLTKLNTVDSPLQIRRRQYQENITEEKEKVYYFPGLRRIKKTAWAICSTHRLDGVSSRCR